MLLRTLNAKSPARNMKMAKLATWSDRPTSMTSMPACCPESSPSLAVAVMPPPAAWRTRLRKSQEMKVKVYVRGLKRECSSP